MIIVVHHQIFILEAELAIFGRNRLITIGLALGVQVHQLFEID
jgi:hypothetical protein